MKEAAHQILRNNVTSHWWNISKERILSELIESLEIPCAGNILELGVGTGNFLSKLKFANKFGIDSYRHQKYYNDFTFIQADINKLPLKESTVDLLLLIDVLEHVEDDAKVIANCLRILKKNGKLFIFAPALQMLWSDLDEIGMHFRRYTIKTIEKLIKNTSVEHKVVKKSYINFLLFPYILIARIMQGTLKKIIKDYDSSSLRQPNKIINGIFKFIFSSEAFFLKFVNFPVGVSCIYIIEKK